MSLSASVLLTALVLGPAQVKHEFPIDGSISGSWYTAERSGEGWVVQVMPDNQAFVAWFTYPPTLDDGPQLWLVGSGTVSNDVITIDNLQQFSGPQFGPDYDPADLVAQDWGPLLLGFETCAIGELSFTGPAEFGEEIRPIERLTAIGDLPCGEVAQNAQPGQAKGSARRPVSSAWYDPSHNGEGWFLEELGDGRVNLYWFTYDDQGRQAWITGVGNREGDVIQIDELFLVTGPVFGAGFSSDDVTLTPWGSLSFTLQACDLASLSYASDLPGFGSGTLAPQRLTRLAGLECQDLPDQPLISGTWQDVKAAPTARSELSAAQIDGKVYVVGGFGGTSVLEAYDPASDAWTTLAPIPQARNHHMAGALNGELYVFGGFINDLFGTVTRTAYAYNPQTNSWRQLADLPGDAASAGRAVALDGHLYIVGGIGPRGFRYDPATDSYDTLPAAGGSRDHSTVVAFQGEVWVLGGRGRFSGAENSVRILNPQSGEWRDGPAMQFVRSGFAAAVVQGQIMVAGGEILGTSPAMISSFEVFAPATGQWRSGPSLPLALHGFGAVELGGRLFTAGGSTLAGGISNPNRNLFYDPEPPGR